MLPAQLTINRYKRLLALQGFDPQDELDNEIIEHMKLEIERLEAGLQDYYDNQRKEKV